MSSSTSSSDPPADPWRRFVLRFLATVGGAIALIYAFVVLVDPFDTLPIAWPADRPPVASNARFAFPALARSDRFDSALFGTSTSRLLRPAAIDPLFGSRLVNLSMNDATVHEQVLMMQVFLRAHPAPRLFMLGLDVRWCATGDDYQRYTGRPVPAWMYEENRWAGLANMLNLHAIETAGQMFGILAGMRTETYGRDGYTRFVPPDAAYDRVKVARNLAAAGPMVPPGPRAGAPEAWRFPALDDLRPVLAAIPPATRVVLFFVPYHQVLQPPAGSADAAAWDACKRRVTALGRGTVIDFMIPSPITTEADNYWDPLHFTTGVADRLARDLLQATQGAASDDYRLLRRD